MFVIGGSELALLLAAAAVVIGGVIWLARRDSFFRKLVVGVCVAYVLIGCVALNWTGIGWFFVGVREGYYGTDTPTPTAVPTETPRPPIHAPVRQTATQATSPCSSPLPSEAQMTYWLSHDYEQFAKSGGAACLRWLRGGT